MAFTPRSAKNAKVRINNTVFTAKEWTVTPRVSESDTSNFEGAGQEDVETGITGLDVSITFDWDAGIGATPYDLPLNLQPGQNVAAKLYINDVTGPFWSIPTLKILTAPNTAKVREMQGGQITGKAKPGWLPPSGAF